MIHCVTNKNNTPAANAAAIITAATALLFNTRTSTYVLHRDTQLLV